MRYFSHFTAIGAGCALFAGVAVAAWTTAGGDAQRSNSARTDTRISIARMPEFRFLWKVKVNNAASQSYSLSPAAIMDSYIGYRGFRSYAFFGGASNKAIALDTDLGKQEWEQSLGAVAPGGTALCPGGMTGGVTRPTVLSEATGAAAGRGGGRAAQRAESGVSAPEQGAITIGQGRGRAPAAVPAGASGGRGASGRGGPPRGRQPEMFYAVSTDGMLHSLFISNGNAAKPAVRFLPANANASGLLMVNEVVYASTGGNCGGAPNGVWAIDLSAESPTPMHWATNGGSVAGTVGPALGNDGSIYAATGDGDYSPVAFSDSVVVLDGKTLKLKDWFSPGKSEFTSSPVVFPYKGRDMVAVANKDGHLYLLDSAELGGGDHKTPLAVSTPYASSGAGAGALSSWEDSGGTRWIMAGASGGVVAFKLADQNGKLTLQPGWVSREIASPLPPIFVNGIVFAVSGGSKPGVLYALDGTSGKEIWNSGSTITAPVHSGELAVSAGQLYLGADDSTIYTFGVPLVPDTLSGK